MTDADWAEREYNPRLIVADVAAITDRWTPRAMATRERHPPVADIAYGPHPRERIDLFRVADARGTVVYIHGGYWRSRDKVDTSWIADGFLDQGLSVALFGYPLTPEVDLAAICDSTRRAFAHLWREVLTEGERRRVVVTGHSAGGYLAALHLATDWTGYGLPADPLAGVVPVAGVFELAPLIPTSMNADIRLTPESAAALSLTGAPVRSRAPLVVAVGGDESAEFHRQQSALAAAWSTLRPTVLPVPDTNHFDVIDSLAEPGGLLNRVVLSMIG